MTALRLRDGRALAYDEFGDPNGAPVFYFHGFPNSRRNGALFHDSARRHRLRLIALDRPGFGESDFQPNRRLGSWPDDVAEAADALGIDRFSVLGYSGGGPYAAACAAKLPDRIAAAGIMSGIGPTTEPAATRGFPLSTRIGMWFWRHFPFLIAIAMWFMGLAARRNTRRMVGWFARSMPAVDRAVLERPEVWEVFRDDFREAFRQGSRAAAWEMRLYLRAWDFRPQDARPGVLLWHGDADTIVPVSFGRFLADALPDCQATFYPGEGHLLPVAHADEIAAALRRAAS